MKTPLIVIAAALGGSLIAQPALAESVSVQYKDLDLSTTAGQKQLNNRIDTAARKVCGFSQRTTGTRIADQEARTCVADAKQKLEKHVAALAGKDKGKEVAGS